MGKKDLLVVLTETADGAFALDRDARILLWNQAAVFVGLVIILGLVGTIILASLHLWQGALWLVVAIALTELTGDFALLMVLLKSGLFSTQAPPTSQPG